MSWQYHLIALTNSTVRELLSQSLLIPKHLIYKLRKEQRVQINHRYLPMNFQVNPGDSVDLTFNQSDFQAVQTPIIAAPDYVTPIYETDDLIVVNKRRGDKTHPNQPGESGATINQVAGYLAPKNQQPYIIHRLDQQTSGAIIFGKNPVVVPILTRLISEKQIQRNYLAWVDGIVKPANGTIDLPIGLDPNDQRKRLVNGINAVPAVTHYQVIRTINHRTLVQITLATGRTHQIRVHFAAIHHPLVGDPLYNQDSEFPLQLHSFQLDLIQPFEMNHHLIKAPLPDDFIM
ncbi:RluA family pseudouridine synthase [Lactobacillus sp. Sy-1]|uniref:RluA family pseudouridine synthase n=1 Tax=Lactobacillus sp. Sy-1 TaxID=2109645 RepID=UPI001C55DBB2|nr:RluA family pseudouridine synthase [Lactobacillus sp. Sy-1]MBW1604902.1 RluA family pseudouridine synthase [Lactobacillus sp. Sy-1]